MSTPNPRPPPPAPASGCWKIALWCALLAVAAIILGFGTCLLMIDK